MFKHLIALALLCVSVTSYSATIDTTGLSEAQVAELKAIAAKKVAETATNADKKPSTEQVTAGVALAATWGTQAAQAAEGFAKAMGIAAKELNVTVNDFLVSPAGMLTAGLIVWKLAGAAILKALYGVVFLSVGLYLCRLLYLRLFTYRYEKTEYSWLGGLFKGSRMIRIPKSINDFSTEGEWLVLWIMVIMTFAVMAFGAMFF